MPAPLTREGILDTAEQVLRRFGPDKTTVVDVARALDVSHGTVYRHFGSKAALREAVTQRWLDRVSAPLEEIAAAHGPADQRLREWVRTLAATKQGIALEDPELFATFRRVTDAAGEVVDAHVAHLAAQVSVIVAQGVDQGAFAVDDPVTAGLAVLQATALFHHPAHSEEWGAAGLPEQLERVLDLLVAGLAAR